MSTKFKDQEKTVEKGFNFQNYKEVSNELVKITNGNDLYNNSLLAGHKLINSNVQETKEYYKVTQQLQDGNWMKNIVVYIDKNTGKMYQFSKNVRDNMIFAITSGGIGSALKRSSSTLKEANNTLEQSIGLITATNSAIQDPEKVGTALKTVSMRLRGVKDDMVEIVPKLRETIKDLSGVEIMQDENTYKSTYDILKSVAGVWNNLTDVKRATLTEIMFGKHQGLVGVSLLQNFNVAIQATETAINSAGSAAKEQERYMDEINAKINTFKEISTKLATQMVNSDLIKGIIEFGTSIQRMLSLTIDKIGSLGTTFVLASGGLSIFRKDFRDSITNLIPPLQKLDRFTKQYLDTLNTKIVFKKKAIAEDRLEGLSTKSLTKDLWRLTIAEKAVAIGSMAMQAAITMGISLAISGVISVVSKWINHLEELKTKNKEVLDSYQQAARQYSDTISYLQFEAKTYDELKNKTSLTTEDQKKLAEVKSKIIDIFPELLVGYDKENNIILDQKKSTSDLIELLKEKNKLENQKLLSNGSKQIEETQKSLKDSNHEISQLQAKLELINKRPAIKTDHMQGDVKYDTKNIEDMTAKADQLKKEQSTGKNVTNELAKAEEDLTKVQIERKEILDKISVKESEQRAEMSKIKPYISAIINEYGGLDEAQRKMIPNMINITPDNLFKINKGDFTQFIADTQKQIESLKDNINLKKIDFVISLKALQPDDIKDYFEAISKLAQDIKQ